MSRRAVQRWYHSAGHWAKLLKVSTSTILRVRLGNTWKHLRHPNAGRSKRIRAADPPAWGLVLRTTALVALVLTVASGCSPRDAPAPTYSVGDSAGVTIYENSEGEWSEATAWRLSSEPILTIGELDGPEEYLLFQVIGARRLSNGNIVIANGGTQELRFYDPSGTHLQSIGGEGEGPGEFRRLEEPWPLGSDSIVTWDLRNARLTVFDINGQLGRSFRLDPIPDGIRPYPRGVLADNSLLVYATVLSEGQLPLGQRPLGVYRDSILYARYSLEGAHLTTLIRRQGGEQRLFSGQGGGIAGSLVLYAPVPTATAFGDRLYYGSGESWEIEVYSPDGALTHLFGRAEQNRPFTLETEFEARNFALWPPTPETLPAYRSFIASDDGSLWVENYTRPSEQPSWAVFRDDGRYLGDVETPMGAQVTHVGDDFMLVIWEDELEVEQVQMYELIKP